MLLWDVVVDKLPCSLYWSERLPHSRYINAGLCWRRISSLDVIVLLVCFVVAFFGFKYPLVVLPKSRKASGSGASPAPRKMPTKKKPDLEKGKERPVEANTVEQFYYVPLEDPEYYFNQHKDPEMTVVPPLCEVPGRDGGRYHAVSVSDFRSWVSDYAAAPLP